VQKLRKEAQSVSMLAASLQHNESRRHQQNPLQSIQMRDCKGTVLERDVAVNGWTGSLQSRDGFVVKSGKVV